jgi:hypothetical protein
VAADHLRKAQTGALFPAEDAEGQVGVTRQRSEKKRVPDDQLAYLHGFIFEVGYSIQWADFPVVILGVFIITVFTQFTLFDVVIFYSFHL